MTPTPSPAGRAGEGLTVEKPPTDQNLNTEESPTKEDTTKTIESKAGNNPITNETLTAVWNNFANEFKTEDPRLYSVLTAFTPNLENETKIIFQINNTLQKESLLKTESELLRHLKTVLDNKNVEIEFVIAEKIETTKIAYTNEEKFAEMSRKNPALMTFKQQLHLDFF